MRRAIRIHRRDFVAIIVLVLLAAVVSGYIFAHQPSFSGIFGLFSKSYYTVNAAVRPGVGGHIRAGAEHRHRRRPGRARRWRDRRERARGREDEHLQEVPADLPERDRAAASPDPAEGHVPGARPGNRGRRRDTERRHARSGSDEPRCRLLGDPLVARHRHARLPAAAARGRRAGVQEPGQPWAVAEPERGRGPARGLPSGSRRSTATRPRSRACSRSARGTSAARSTACGR